MIYIANLFSLIGTILGHITNLRKDRPKMLHNAVFTTLCNAMANFFAGSKAGGISCLCSTLRYYLIYKNVKPIIVCSIFIPTTTILILLNNTEGFLCLFPICSSIIAILTLCYVKDMRKMKAIFIITTSLIICHDLYFKLYISASSNIISIVENIIVIYRLSIEKRKQEKEKKQ